ncbi:hypothetical protein K8R43_06675, partial [archaeon]|nr:hypothetical protein [archaeon]
MKRAQVSIEYLLLLSTVIAMIVIVVLLMNRFITTSADIFPIKEDQMNCSIGGGKEISVTIGTETYEQYVDIKIDLLDYFDAYDGTLDTAPGKIRFGDKEYAYYGTTNYPFAHANQVTDIDVCSLQREYQLNYSTTKDAFFLESSVATNWFTYNTTT